MEKMILVKYGEIGLRGKNKYIYENQLRDFISRRLQPLDGYYVDKERSRLIVRKTTPDFSYDKVIRLILPIMGIVALCPGILTDDQDISHLRKLSVDYLNTFFNQPHTSFKVETKRANKAYPLRSQEVSADIGGYILDNTGNFSVNVNNPDMVLYIELRKMAYLYGKIIPGQGGLPVGSSGKGLLLLSAGIDSPVAGYFSAKRGIGVEAVYFHSPPYTSQQAQEKVFDLCKQLAPYLNEVRLHVVPFTDTQLYLHDHVPPEKLTLLLKRSMLRCGEILAAQRNCDVLITGDSVGQVASQTLKSIRSIDDAVNIPVLRPLCGFDKQEIISVARKLGTYEISIRPFEDCCTLFSVDHPETKPKLSIIQNIDRNMKELAKYIETAANTAEVYEF